MAVHPSSCIRPADNVRQQRVFCGPDRANRSDGDRCVITTIAIASDGCIIFRISASWLWGIAVKSFFYGIAVAVAAVTTASIANAADMAKPVYKAPIAATPVYSWTGFYIGGNAGYAWGSGRTDLSANGSNVSFPAILPI